MKFKRNKNGFIIFLLDFLFVTAGILLLIIEFFRNQETLASIINAFKGSF